MSTTISTHPITELEFPSVTVCPPWGSNTALNYLLEKVKYVNFTKEKRQELLNIARDVFIDLPNKKNSKQIIRMLSFDNMRRIASGQINLPEVVVQNNGDFNMHFMIELSDYVVELVGDGQLVLSVESEEEWSYMLQNTSYRMYRNGKSLNMLDAEDFCLTLDSHLASVVSEEEQDNIKQVATKLDIWLGGKERRMDMVGNGWMEEHGPI